MWSVKAGHSNSTGRDQILNVRILLVNQPVVSPVPTRGHERSLPENLLNAPPANLSLV